MEGAMTAERPSGNTGGNEEPLERIRGMLKSKSAEGVGRGGATEGRVPPYGDLTLLNTSRLILDSVGSSFLEDIFRDFTELLGTTCAVYEKNGDYALRMFPPGWCRFMDQASRDACPTADNREAIESGQWHCHESCWKEAALLSIRDKGPVDVACRGGIRLFAAPILAGGEAVGAVSMGYGDPPRDEARLNELANAYGVRKEELRRHADAYPTRPPFILDWAGKHLVSVARWIGEIVERRRAEQALHRSEEEFRALLDHAKDAVLIHDAQGRIREANLAACERLGYRREEFLKMTLLDLVDPEQTAQVPQRFNTLRKQGHHFFESVHRRRDGTAVPVEVSVRRLERAREELFLAVCSDLTERKRAEAALAEVEKRFSVFMEHLPAGVFIKDPSGRLLFANRYLKELFDWGDCVGKTTWELVPRELAERMVADDRKALNEGPLVIQETVTDPRGTEHFFETYKFPVEVVGSPPLLGGITVDISKRKRAEDALEKRILALTQPLDDAGNISFEDLFNLADLQHLQDLFAEVWGVAALITRPDGTPITRPSNFTDFCSKFIRRSEKGIHNCQVSDATLGRHNPSGPIIQKCLSAGLWGAGASITVGGRHIASWLIGQVRNEAQSEAQILEYARLIGVDEGAFREAFLRVPIMSERTFEQIAHSLFALANQLSNTAFQNIQQARFIAQLKRAEEILRESEAKFRGICEESPIGIELYDRQGTLLHANRAAYDIFGVSDPSTVKKFNLFGDPNLSEELKARLRRGENARIEIPFDFERVRALGLYETAKSGVVHLDVLVTPLKEVAQGPVIGYLVHIRDITERKRAEEALRDSEARYAVVVEQAKDGVVIIQDDVLQFVNRSVGDILGYAQGEMIHTPFSDYVAPEYRPMIAQRVRDRLEGKEVPSVYEAALVRKDGTRIEVELSANIIQYGGKTADLGLIRDITERKRMEEERRRFEVQMREVQKLESLGVLAGGIAHDFNNLLMAILGNADLALASISPTSRAHHHVEEIARASLRAADLCRQMLAYSGKGRFMVGFYDLSEIVREMAQMLDVSISKKARTRFSLTPDLPAVEADATQLRQVVMNLITNASDALGEEGGVISIATGVKECHEAYLSEGYLDDGLPGGTYVCLEVSDTGCGMDAETLSKVFDPFFTTKFVGRGLGLAAVLGIVRGHKGAVKVRSEVGEGTTFEILLPAVAWESGGKAGVAGPGMSLQGGMQGGGTILLVDDDPRVRSVASEMLVQLGFQVLGAENGREALDVFRTRRAEIACVILDLSMPVMGGEEAFRELRNVSGDVPVLVSSGYTEQDVAQRFAGRKPTGFIQKPYTIANLRGALEEALRPPEDPRPA